LRGPVVARAATIPHGWKNQVCGIQNMFIEVHLTLNADMLMIEIKTHNLEIY
jgi:hypothetical protein